MDNEIPPVNAAAESSEERRLRLLREACLIPLSPGVYIMKDARGKVIYVGKSRKLRDRVSRISATVKKI